MNLNMEYSSVKKRGCWHGSPTRTKPEVSIGIFLLNASSIYFQNPSEIHIVHTFKLWWVAMALLTGLFFEVVQSLFYSSTSHQSPRGYILCPFYPNVCFFLSFYIASLSCQTWKFIQVFACSILLVPSTFQTLSLPDTDIHSRLFLFYWHGMSTQSSHQPICLEYIYQHVLAHVLLWQLASIVCTQANTTRWTPTLSTPSQLPGETIATKKTTLAS